MLILVTKTKLDEAITKLWAKIKQVFASKEYVDAALEDFESCDHEVNTTMLSGKVVITKDARSFAVNAEEIVKPAVPTLPAGGDFYNSKFITIKAASGAVIYYTTDGSTPTTASTLYTSAFTIGSTSAQITIYTIKAIAVKNGMSSDVASQTYTCYRRVATPTATANGNKYSASRTITFACNTADATIEYKVGSEEWTEGSSVTINTTSTVYFRAKKRTWKASAEGSQSFTLNAKKCYIGGAGASLSSLSGLTGVEADNLNGERTITLASAAYIWFVVPSESTITSITSGPLAVPFALKPNSVSGYNCYRTDLEIIAGTHTYNIA